MPHTNDLRKPAYHTEVTNEARRIMQICNACRYCEGFCAVFPAMTLRRSFTDGDLSYLANLCHNCRGCYYACQYAEPHPFDVNVPRTMEDLRVMSWTQYAWPQPLVRVFAANGLIVSLLSALLISVTLAGLICANHGEAIFSSQEGGNFYALMSHNVMISIAGPLFGFAILSILISQARFARAMKSPQPDKRATGRTTRDVLTLKYLGGGGYGCNDSDERFSMIRRMYHHATFYGFMLCFAATSIGTLYHYGLGWKAPYSILSLPVMSGLIGGLLLCIGTAGLFVMNKKTDPALKSQLDSGLSEGFIALLFFSGASGLLLTLLRETSWMGITLIVHLGFVFAFFALIPYSKMVHGLYRLVALFRFHVEKESSSS